MKKYIQNNKNLWNEWVKIHTTTKNDGYDIEEFCLGKTMLNKIESEELGDIYGKSVLHLQCHFGLDSLSLVRDKGCRVTGVDISPDAIKYAKELSDRCKIQAKFICSDIYDLNNVLFEKFDVVFTSYGVLTWLNDLDKWAELIAHYLKPSGIFYIVEFHPFTHMFDENWQYITEPYFYDKIEPIQTQEEGSYANKQGDFSGIAYEWPHTLGEQVTALCKAGFIINFLHEFPYIPYNCFPSLEEVKPRQYVVKNSNRSIPLTYSIKATCKL